MRIPLFIPLLIAVISGFNTSAQKLSAGYIVNVNKDTIRGFILDGTDAELSLSIEFRMGSENSEAVQYSPSDLLGFGFDYGRIFRGFTFVNNETIENDSLTVFAKRIIDGKISLYTLERDKKKQPDMFLTNNFSRKTVHITEPLKIITTTESGEKFTNESKTYLGFLRFVKTDSLKYYEDPGNIRYNENSIKKDILKYNKWFQKYYTVTQYISKKAYFNDITLGMAITKTSDAVSFRGAFYRNKFFPEKSRNLSLMKGISYRYTSSNEEFDPNVQNSNQNFRQQFLSIIPFGFNLHGDSKFIRPYFYLGAGLAFLIETNHYVVEYVDKGSQTELIIFPTINVGAGVKIKAGSKFIIAEITPSGNGSGIFMNLGYSF